MFTTLTVFKEVIKMEISNYDEALDMISIILIKE